MRVAFTSCFSAQLFPSQPVWSEIKAAKPDVLVLLGDSIYLDCGGPYNSSAIQKLSAYEFAQHAHQLYQLQLKQPEFKSLLASAGMKTYAVWDDHDFLWNDACGENVMRNPALKPLVYPSRALFAAYRQALAGSSFPAAPPAWDASTPAPGYQHVQLSPDLHLHLTDGRSWRRSGGRALLGTAQLNEIEAAMNAADKGATHLLASATVVEARNGEAWMKCDVEYQRLLQLGQRHNIIVLSGDIHDNNLAIYDAGPGPRSLYEVTSSGAALRTGVVIGSLQRNWGMLEITAGKVRIDIRKSGHGQFSGSIDRATWK